MLFLILHRSKWIEPYGLQHISRCLTEVLNIWHHSKVIGDDIKYLSAGNTVLRSAGSFMRLQCITFEWWKKEKSVQSVDYEYFSY